MSPGKKPNTAIPAEDEFEIPTFAESRAETGAVLDSLVSTPMQALPRILRYAIHDEYELKTQRSRLYAEIMEVAPELEQVSVWIGDDQSADAAIALAAALDRKAVVDGRTECRSLADTLRLLTLPVPKGGKLPAGYSRVARSLITASKEAIQPETEPFWARIEDMVSGWAALPLMRDDVPFYMGSSAFQAARYVGVRLAKDRVDKAREEAKSKMLRDGRSPEDPVDHQEETRSISEPNSSETTEIPASTDRLVVCRIDNNTPWSPKLKELVGPIKHAVNVPLPLLLVPDLQEALNRLIFEFPYAADVIDTILSDLVGKQTIYLKPLVLVGEPGGGKSLFVRRLGEVLGLGIWRTDASRADGAMFAGTDRRWHTAEPCHPFLAIAQTRQANPLVMIDEIEKAGTRADNGRFWDGLLGFFERETASRYPDPALHAALDLSHVTYVATANTIEPLPSPLRDRLRILKFPRPKVDDLDALFPSIIAAIARERGVNREWIAPLTGIEREMVAAHWKGGSVRRLKNFLETIVKCRDDTRLLQ